jgi:hypothetical protein
MKKIIYLFLYLALTQSLANASAASNADAKRLADIKARRAGVANQLQGTVAKLQAKQKLLTFVSSKELEEISVELTASELNAVNKELKSKADKALVSPCKLARIIGLAPYAVMHDTFGKNQPNMALAKGKGKYSFNANQRFALKTPVLAPYNGNNHYGVVIAETIKADGPLKTATYEYTVQFGQYTSETTDSELLRLAGQSTAPEFIGYKKPTAAANPHQNANSLSPQAHLAAMEAAAATAAAIANAKSPKSENPNSLTPLAASPATPTDSGAAAAKTPSPQAAGKKFVPKFLKHERFNFGNKGTIVRQPAAALGKVAEDSPAGASSAAVAKADA